MAAKPKPKTRGAVQSTRSQIHSGSFLAGAALGIGALWVFQIWERSNTLRARATLAARPRPVPFRMAVPAPIPCPCAGALVI